MTRSEAIYFAECLKNNWTINLSDMETFCDMVIAMLSKREKEEWTPCSERPPEEESEVLVTTSWNDVCKAWYSNGKWRAEFINEYDDNEILAWMPLPEPWKGEKEGYM